MKILLHVESFEPGKNQGAVLYWGATARSVKFVRMPDRTYDGRLFSTELLYPSAPHLTVQFGARTWLPEWEKTKSGQLQGILTVPFEVAQVGFGKLAKPRDEACPLRLGKG